MSDSHQEPSGPNRLPLLPGEADPDAVFAQCVRAAREATGMTQQQMGAAMGGAGYPMRQNTISKIESGERPVIIGEAVALASILGVDLADLLTAPPADEDVKQAIAAVGAAERQVARLERELDKVSEIAAMARVQVAEAAAARDKAQEHLASLRRAVPNRRALVDQHVEEMAAKAAARHSIKEVNR